MKIYFIEPTGISIEECRTALPGHDIIEIDSRGWPDEMLIASTQDADVLALTNRPLSEPVIASLPSLKLIAVAFAGIDHVDQAAAASRNITIKNAAGYANTAVAELVLGLMISLARRIPHNNAAIRQGSGTNTGTELKAKSLGIIGYGAIGREVERLALAFQMNPLIYDRRNTNTLQSVFSKSDFISLHVPLTAGTRGLVSSELLNVMKPTSFLINCSRGPVVNSSDLCRALRDGRLSGAALDVFDTEPPLPPDSALFQFANVIATPHIGFNTAEALQAKGQMTLNAIRAFVG